MIQKLQLQAGMKVLEVGGQKYSFSEALKSECKKNKCPYILYHQGRKESISDSNKLIDDGFMLEEDDSSVDRIIVNELFDKIRMDQLYMIFSEARRVLKPRSLFIIRNFCSGNKWHYNFINTKILRKKLLITDHYFSPEDWLLVEREVFSTGISTLEELILQKI